MNSLEVMEFLVEKFGFEMKYDHTVTGSGIWSHAAVHYDGERLVEVFDGDAPSYWLGMRINGEQYELGYSGTERLTCLNTEEKILHEFSKLGFIPNEKILTPCEIQDYLVDNYGFKVSKSVHWEYMVQKDGNEFSHDRNGTFLEYRNILNFNADVYNKVNTTGKLETYLRKIGVNKIPKETLLDAFQVVTILIRDYGFTEDKASSPWSHAVVNKNLQLNFHHSHDSSIYYQFQGSEVYGNQLEFMNTEEKLHNFMKQFTKGTSMDKLNSLQIMEIAVRDYGFTLELDNGGWSHMARLNNGNLYQLYDDAPSQWLGFRKDGDSICDASGNAAWKVFNSEAKLHSKFAELGILKVLPKTITEKPCNDFKVGDKIIDNSNNSYLIVSEFMTTGMKMFTLQGVNSGSFYTQHATMINCCYTKEKQPILWTTMADGARIKGTGGRGCYTITRKWTTLKNVEAKEAERYYILFFNKDVLISGTNCVDDYLEYANKHNLE